MLRQRLLALLDRYPDPRVAFFTAEVVAGSPYWTLRSGREQQRDVGVYLNEAARREAGGALHDWVNIDTDLAELLPQIDPSDRLRTYTLETLTDMDVWYTGASLLTDELDPLVDYTARQVARWLGVVPNASQGGRSVTANDLQRLGLRAFDVVRLGQAGASGAAEQDHGALLDRIRADPDDESALLVYADWLQEQGHPLGELIVLQRAAAHGAATSKQRARAALILHKHRHEIARQNAWLWLWLMGDPSIGQVLHRANRPLV